VRAIDVALRYIERGVVNLS